MCKHRGPGPTPRVSDQQALLQPQPGATPFYTHARVHDPWRTPLCLPRSFASYPISVHSALSWPLCGSASALGSPCLCICPEFSLTALSPASIRGIAGHSLVGLFSTCFKRLFSMEIQRPGPRWPDSGLHIKSSVALTSISSFVTCQRGPPQPQFLLLLCLT